MSSPTWRDELSRYEGDPKKNITEFMLWIAPWMKQMANSVLLFTCPHCQKSTLKHTEYWTHVDLCKAAHEEFTRALDVAYRKLNETIGREHYE